MTPAVKNSLRNLVETIVKVEPSNVETLVCCVDEKFEILQIGEKMESDCRLFFTKNFKDQNGSKSKKKTKGEKKSKIGGCLGSILNFIIAIIVRIMSVVNTFFYK